MRTQLDGATVSERLTLTALSLQHAQLDIAVLAASGGKRNAPPMEDFIPAMPEQPEEPRTFEFWAQKLLPLAR